MMYHNWGGDYGVGVGAPTWILALFAFAAPFILIIVLWSVFWKGLGLWHSARRGSYWWFFFILVVNTAGILEIIYLFGILKLRINELFSTTTHNHHS